MKARIGNSSRTGVVPAITCCAGHDSQGSWRYQPPAHFVFTETSLHPALRSNIAAKDCRSVTVFCT